MSTGRFHLVAVVAFILLFDSCVSTDTDVSTLVSADAYAAVFVKSPAKLLAAVDALSKRLDIKRLMPGGQTPSELLLSTLNGKATTSLAEIDGGRPIAVTAVPSKNGDIGLVVWIPVKRGATSVEVLSTDRHSTETWGLVGGYAVMAHNAPLPEAPFRTKADIPNMAAYAEDELVLWVNFGKGRDDFGADFFDALVDSLDALASPKNQSLFEERGLFGRKQSHKADSDKSQVGKALRELADLEGEVERIVESVAAFDVSFRFAQEGILCRAGCTARPSSALHDFIKAFSSTSPGVPYVKYLENGMLLSMAANVSPAVAETMFDWYRDLFKDLGTDFFDYLQEIRELNSFMGANQAMNLDFKLDSAGLSKLSGSNSADVIIKALDTHVTLDFRSVTELRNAAGYREAQKKWLDKFDTSKFMQDLLKSVGIEINPTVDAATVTGLSVDTIRLNLALGQKITSGMDRNTAKTARLLTDYVNDRLTIRLAYKSDRVFSGLATAEAVAAAATADKATNPLADAETYRAFARNLPADTRIVIALSLQKIVDLIKLFVPDIGKNTYKNLGSLLSYVSGSANAISLGVWLSIDDLATIVPPANKANN